MRRRALLLGALPTPAWSGCRVPDAGAAAAAQSHAWSEGEGLLLRAQGQRLQLHDAAGALLRDWPCADRAGRRHAQAEDLRAHAARCSFLVALPGLAELWEIQLAPDAPPIHDGLVHDHRLNEAIASPGQYGIRRSVLGEVPYPLLAPPDQAWVAGPSGGGQVLLVNLDVRREIARWPAQGAPRWDGERLWLQAPDGRWQARRPPRFEVDYCAW